MKSIRTKKRAIIVSIFIIFIATMLSCFLQFNAKHSNMQEYFLNIFIGIIGSAVVTLIIYAVEYRIAKVNACIKYWDSSNEVLNNFINLQYLHFDEPIDLISDYYCEVSRNKMVENEISQLPKDFEISKIEFLKIVTKAKDKLIDWMKPHYPLLKELTNQKELLNVVDGILKDKLKKYDLMIEDLIDQYIELSTLNYKNVENAYGEIDFFINNNYRKLIYNQIHIVQRNMLKEIKNLSFHFKLYKSGHGGNKAVMIDYIVRLQNKIFEADTREDHGLNTILIYNKYFNVMDKTLEEFRAHIYGKNPEYNDRLLTLSFSTYIQDDAHTVKKISVGKHKRNKRK